MFRFFLKRVALTLPTFFALMFVTFTMIRLVPGDPIEVRRGERGISPERLAELRHEMGLDQPIWKQFFDYVWALLHGDFGTSIISKTPIADEFLTLFPATLELTFCAMLFAIVVGIPAGVIAAARRGGIYDQSLMGAGADRLFHADFLVGPHPHPRSCRTRLDLTPVSGRVDLIKYLLPARHRLHADRFAPLRPEGRVHGCGAPSHPAHHRAGHRAARGHRTHDALIHARGAGRGLCAHRQGQGPVRRSASLASMPCATR